MPFPILTFIVFLPLLGAMLILFTPKNNAALIKTIATAVTGLALLLSIGLVLRFEYLNPGIQFEEI